MLHRVGDPVVPVTIARATVPRFPNAVLVELPGTEHIPYLGDTEEMLAEIRAFIGAPAPMSRPERVLATVLFTDIVGSTDKLARLGDAAWSSQLARHEEIVRDGLSHFDGRLIKSTGDGVLQRSRGRLAEPRQPA